MLNWLTKLFKNLNISFSWTKTNCKNQKQEINGDPHIAIKGQRGRAFTHHTTTLSKIRKYLFYAGAELG